MKKAFKIIAWILGSLILILVALMTAFIYKVKNGFPVSYETEIPAIAFPENQTKVLLFSKATGFHHTESIEAGKVAFEKLAEKNNWFLYSTEEGGAFNPEQLAKFDVVVFNNSTGRLLSDQQQQAFQEYITVGGKFIGIHGAGDDSHHKWGWYEENLIGAKFSHHPLDPQLQEAVVSLNDVVDSVITAGLNPQWSHTDEWYIFFENPRAKGFSILYSIDGNKIIPNGNILFTKDKNFGMGKDHPIAWYRATGRGRAFYTSMGHNALAWKQEPFLRMLENAVNWK
jgi:uncharacterized protein